MESNGVNNVRRTISPPTADDKPGQWPKAEAISDKTDDINSNSVSVSQQKKSLDESEDLPNQSEDLPTPTNTSVNGEENSEDTSAERALSTLPTSSSRLIYKQHPLKSKWTFWFLNSKKELDWLERLKKVCTISTIEEFWGFYENIRPPSGMFGCDYNFFRNDIEPLWEVKENKDGGRLVVQVDKQRNNDLLDNWWLELLLACIGEQFDDVSDQVCGAVCNIRQKGSKISIWTTNAAEEEKNKKIGQVIKARLLEVPGATAGKPYLKVNYEDHVMVQQKTSSAIPSRFVL